MNWLSLRTPNVVSSLFVLHSSLNLLPRGQQLHGTLNYLVGLVPNLEVLAHIPDISRYKGFQLHSQVFLRLSQFSLILRLYLLLLALCDNAFNERRRNLVACQELVEILILALEFLAMRIDKLQTVVDDNALGCQLRGSRLSEE